MCLPKVLTPDEGESIWEGNTMHLTGARGQSGPHRHHATRQALHGIF
jgi:hypothetical protein